MSPVRRLSEVHHLPAVLEDEDRDSKGGRKDNRRGERQLPSEIEARTADGTDTGVSGVHKGKSLAKDAALKQTEGLAVGK